MNSKPRGKFSELAIRLLFVLLLFSVCRIVFLLFNIDVFRTENFQNIAWAFVAGIRFDITAILYLNIALILLYLEPFDSVRTKPGRIIAGFLFIIPNSLAVLANLADTGWFSFTLKRTTADWFNTTGLGGDLIQTLPAMVSDNWLLLALFIVFLIIIIQFDKKIFNHELRKKTQLKRILIQTAILIISLPVIVLGLRGGLQYRPIGIMTAAQNSNARLAPLVLNTPFTLMRTLGKQELKEPVYFSNLELDKLIDLKKDFSTDSGFNSKNVVVIILESFSSEYIGYLNQRKTYTPFLDSLMANAMVFTNAYANSKRSIEGVPAIVSGIPALMSEAYITSVYAGNKMNSIASLLKKQGYATAFYHGGQNGTMGFDNFTRMAGYDKYLGKQEYPDPKDDDGNWGIYDEPYLKYVAGEINKLKAPFHVGIMTLSSHHPYSIPEKYKAKFGNGTSELLQSILYADYALQQFFDQIKKTEWYGNTLFVLTADHTGPATDPYYQSKTGIFKIPILFFEPGSALKGKNPNVVQHADILPGIMDVLNYPKTFESFGQSIFRSSDNSIAINYQNDIYQAISKNRLMQFDGENVIGYYNTETDSLLQNDIKETRDEMYIPILIKLKAFIQKYNTSLIHNSIGQHEF